MKNNLFRDKLYIKLLCIFVCKQRQADGG